MRNLNNLPLCRFQETRRSKTEFPLKTRLPCQFVLAQEWFKLKPSQTLKKGYGAFHPEELATATLLCKGGSSVLGRLEEWPSFALNATSRYQITRKVQGAPGFGF